MLKKILGISVFLMSTAATAEPEDWYFAASIGSANNTNPASVENVITSAENTFGSERLSLSIDIGVYWPVMDSSTLLGVVSNVSSDSVHDYYNTNIITHNTSHVGISAVKYLAGDVGNGFFVRGDLGAARAEYTLLNNTYGIENGTGTAVLLGMGYGFPVSGQSRMTLSLNFVNRTIDNEEFKSTQLMLGGLW